MPTLPIVNNNGTSRKELINQRRRVCDCLRVTITALREMAPHGRDYQTDPTCVQFNLAQTQHKQRTESLTSLLKSIETEAELLYNEGLEK